MREVAYKSPEWWAVRRTHVGGSDLGPILGMSPWRTRDDVLAEKLNAPEPSTDAQKRGLRLEVGVLAIMGHELGLDWYSCDSLVDDERRYLASPDAMATVRGESFPFEAKTTTVRAAADGWGRPSPKTYRPERIPDGYLAQTQWGLMLTGCATGYLGCLAAATDLSDDGDGSRSPSLNFALYRIDADERIHRHLAREADRFLADLDAARKEAA